MFAQATGRSVFCWVFWLGPKSSPDPPWSDIEVRRSLLRQVSRLSSCRHKVKFQQGGEVAWRQEEKVDFQDSVAMGRLELLSSPAHDSLPKLAVRLLCADQAIDGFWR